MDTTTSATVVLIKLMVKPKQFSISYLKNNGLVVLLEVEGKDVGEHKG